MHGAQKQTHRKGYTPQLAETPTHSSVQNNPTQTTPLIPKGEEKQNDPTTVDDSSDILSIVQIPTNTTQNAPRVPFPIKINEETSLTGSSYAHHPQAPDESLHGRNSRFFFALLKRFLTIKR